MRDRRADVHQRLLGVAALRKSQVDGLLARCTEFALSKTASLPGTIGCRANQGTSSPSANGVDDWNSRLVTPRGGAGCEMREAWTDLLALSTSAGTPAREPGAPLTSTRRRRTQGHLLPGFAAPIEREGASANWDGAQQAPPWRIVQRSVEDRTGAIDGKHRWYAYGRDE